MIRTVPSHLSLYFTIAATYKYFGFEKETYPGGGGPSFAGGIQGHLFPSRYIDSIVKPNAECALNEACIAPPGASLWNHRFDQSVLSILAHQRHVQVPPYTEFVAAQREQLKPGSLDTESPPFVLWTARKTCSHYSRYHGFST